MTAAAWTPGPALSACNTRRPQRWVQGSPAWEVGGVSLSLSGGQRWLEFGSQGNGNFLWPASELRLAAGTQTELAAQRCQSWDFHGQFLQQDTRWGWISQYIGVECMRACTHVLSMRVGTCIVRVYSLCPHTCRARTRTCV